MVGIPLKPKRIIGFADVVHTTKSHKSVDEGLGSRMTQRGCDQVQSPTHPPLHRLLQSPLDIPAPADASPPAPFMDTQFWTPFTRWTNIRESSPLDVEM